MARASGNVDANGGITSDSSNKNGFTVQAQPNGGAPGTYRVTFTKPFTQTPAVFVNPINTEPMMGAILVGIVPSTTYVDIKIAYNGQYTPYPFSFGAFGDV